MTRLLLAAAAAALAAAPAAAQPGIAAQLPPRWQPGAPPRVPALGAAPFAFAAPGYRYGPAFGGFYSPWAWGGWGWGWGGQLPGPFSAPAAGSARPAPGPVGIPAVARVPVSGEQTATLRLDLPAAAEVWVDGAKQPGGPRAEWVIETPVLRPGEARNLAVRAEWAAAGKPVEYAAELTLRPGDRVRRSILSGTPVDQARRP